MKSSISLSKLGMLPGCLILATAWLGAGSTTTFAQFRPAQRPSLPDFDARVNPVPNAARVAERETGHRQLLSRLPLLSVDFDPLLDSPKFVRSHDGFLTGPQGQGGAISPAALKALPEDDPFRIVKAFLNEHSPLFGHAADILDAARVKSDYRDAHTGLRTVAWEQQLDGVPVFQSVLLAHITKNGELTSVSSRFVPGLAAAANSGTPGRGTFQSAPPISASQAIQLAAQNIGAELAGAKSVSAGSAGAYLLYKTPEQASVRLVWFPLDRSSLRLAWEVLVTKPVSHESFQLIIDAQTGKALLRKNLTFHISNATYNVYDSYSPSPMAPGLQSPGTFQPPLTNRNLIVTPALDTTASPEGWIPDGANTTTGNNIDAFVDRNGDEQPDQPRPQGNPARVFDFPLDLTQDPKTYIDGSTVELFWRANWYHDRLYELGFTEAAGNFQDNNFGRGGLGGDHIICFVQAGADVGQTDNSMFAPAPDGQSGRCYMFTFTGPSPNRDGSLDSEVVVHELTHGTSWRLVGGGGMVLGSLQGDGMGEGWSDFYAEVLLNPAGADPDAAYAMGGYVTYLFAGTGMNQNYYYGIRRYPYCTDMLKNPLTFKDIDPAQALAHKAVPLSPLFSPFDPTMADEVHNQGEVWCVTLWEMHANLVHKYGWAVGNELTLRLTTDGMKLTPAFPNFLQARDGIILADTINNGGANLAEIWNAFAKRGMGYSATSPDGSTTAGVHEAYDVPIISTLGVALGQATISGGNGNGIIDRNECNDLRLALTNSGTVSLTRVSVTLGTLTPETAMARPTASYPDILPGTSATNPVPFKISTSPDFACGMLVKLTVTIRCDQGVAYGVLSMPSGTPGAPLRFDNNSIVFVPSPGSTNSSISVSNVSFAVNKVTVSMFVQASYDYFLKLELIAPDGTTNVLSAFNGLAGQNYGVACSPEQQRTTFDDAAQTPIASGGAPFVGSFSPTEPLSVFAGKSGTNVNGIWQLRVTDTGGFSSAVIDCWSLFITPTLCTDGGGQCPGADMALGMTAQPNPILAGNNLTYTISVTNNGPSTATNVNATCLLPNGVLFVAASSSQGTYAQSGGVISFSVGAMAPRATATLTVVGLPTVPGRIVTTASVSSEQVDFDPSNNSVAISTRINPPTSDLAVAVAAAPSPTLVGSPLTYTVAVTNNGPSSASGITVTNVLPASASILSATNTQGSFTTFGQVVFWSLSGLLPGQGATATIVVDPTVEGTITATATAAGAQFDPITGNNSATVSTVVGAAADLAVGITDFPDPVVTGSNITYTVSVTNFGPSTATAVTVNDALPASVALLSTDATQGTVTVSNSILIWSAGVLSNSTKATLTIVVSATTNGTLSSTATALAAQPDPQPANNSATVSTVVAAPFVTIVASGATLTTESLVPPNGAIDVGETVTMILRLRNAGNVPTRNLVATLATNDGVVPVPPNNPQTCGVLAPSGFPVGRSFSFTATGTNGQTITPTLLLRDGTTTYPPVSFSFTLPNAFIFANTNGIVVPDPAAHPPFPLQAGPAKPYPSAITVSNLTGVLGKVTVTLSNLGHSYPSDINALLVGPGGAKTLLMSHAGSEPVTNLNLTFDDSAPGPLPSTGGFISGAWQPTAYSPDPQLGGFPTNAPARPYATALSVFNGANPNGMWSLYVFDDHDGDDGNILGGWSLGLTMITPVNQLADLGLSAVATPNPCLLGGTLTYTFNITNTGPNTATSVAFTNLLPAGVALVSASSSQGTALTNATSVIASLGPLNAGTNAAVTVVVVPTAAAIPQGLTNVTLTSTASVGADQTDLNPGNNTSAVLTVLNRPAADPGLTQTVVPDPLVVGYNLTNTVVITNSGPGAALNLVLTEAMPFGAGFVRASSTVGTCTNSSAAVTCALGDLAPNATATVTIVLTNSVPGLMTNRVSLTTDSYDPNPANNSATYVTTVTSPAPKIINAGARLTYESGPANGAVDPGETVNVSLVLANIGTLDTVNLKATLLASGGVTLPSGAQYYGMLAQGGPSAARSYSFKAATSLGGAVVASLQLQDERPGVTNNLGTLVFTFYQPSTSSWSYASSIAIPDHGASTPYPATINVSGLTGRVSKATVTLKGLTHTFPHDVNVLLVSPGGSNVLVMSHTGGGHAVTSLTLTFDDAAAGSLPNYDALSNGTYKPTSYDGPVALPGTAPAKTYRTALSGVNWGTPNGAWSLYVFDDTVGDAGMILNGWSLNLTTVLTVGPVVDLAVSLSSAPGSLYLGNNLTNTMTVTNLGPDSATGVVLTNPLPAGVNFISASLSQGSFVGPSGGLMTCNLGNLPLGSGAKVIIVTSPSQAGLLNNAAGAFANEEDLDPASSSAQTTTTVLAEAPARLSGFVSNHQFHLTVSAQPNIVYAILGSTSLSYWVSLSTNTNSAGGTFTFVDTNSPNLKQRFYRTKRLSP